MFCKKSWVISSYAPTANINQRFQIAGSFGFNLATNPSAAVFRNSSQLTQLRFILSLWEKRDAGYGVAHYSCKAPAQKKMAPALPSLPTQQKRLSKEITRHRNSTEWKAQNTECLGVVSADFLFTWRSHTTMLFFFLRKNGEEQALLRALYLNFTPFL